MSCFLCRLIGHCFFIKTFDEWAKVGKVLEKVVTINYLSHCKRCGAESPPMSIKKIITDTEKSDEEICRKEKEDGA